MPEFTKFSVVKTTPVEVGFTVALRFMHGDADAYTTETIVCSTEDEALEVVAAFEGVKNPDADDFYETFGWADWWPRDSTNDWVRAQLRGVSANYTDATGTVYILKAL